MRNYGRIETAAWQSAKLRGAGVTAKLLWAYLIACPHGNALGCFVLPQGYIAIDLELEPTEVLNAVETLSKRGLIEYDNAVQLVRIVGWWGHNRIENGNVAKGIAKVLKTLPKSALVSNAVADLEHIGGEHFNQHIKPGLTKFEPPSNRVSEPDRTATEPPDTGYLIPDSPPLPPKTGLEEKNLENGKTEDDWPEMPEFMRADLRPRFDTVRGGAKRFAGLGERPFKPKDQQRADKDMERHLTTMLGMDLWHAQALIIAARDPNNPDHIDAARTCERESRKHKLGWFHMEAAE